MSAEKSKANKAASLGEGSVPSLVLRFAATTLAALLLNSVYSLTDALFVSWRVGENAMGGISLVFPFVVLQGAISTAVGSGAASVVSRKLGQGDPRAAGEATQTARAVFYLSALLISIIGLLLLDPLLSFMGATPELYLPAKQYFTILLLGNVFSTGFSSIIRAEGNMLYGLLIWVIPISVNIGLDALFILTFNWGIQGSAAATVLSQFLSAMMSVLFFRKLSVQDFKNARPRLKTAGEILTVGVPSLVQMGSLSLATLVLNRVLSETGGTAGVNAFAYISKILTVAVLPFTAVAQAVAPIAGYSFGAGQRRRIQKTFRLGLLLSFLYALLSFGVLCAAPTAFFAAVYRRRRRAGTRNCRTSGDCRFALVFAAAAAFRVRAASGGQKALVAASIRRFLGALITDCLAVREKIRGFRCVVGLCRFQLRGDFARGRKTHLNETKNSIAIKEKQGAKLHPAFFLF